MSITSNFDMTAMKPEKHVYKPILIKQNHPIIVTKHAGFSDAELNVDKKKKKKKEEHEEIQDSWKNCCIECKEACKLKPNKKIRPLNWPQPYALKDPMI